MKTYKEPSEKQNLKKYTIGFCTQTLNPQPWKYCLGNFPRSPVQCWMYERNRWTRISTPTLNGGAGEFFPTFETKVADAAMCNIDWLSSIFST